jgi:hypothetical protein
MGIFRRFTSTSTQSSEDAKAFLTPASRGGDESEEKAVVVFESFSSFHSSAGLRHANTPHVRFLCWPIEIINRIAQRRERRTIALAEYGDVAGGVSD